MTDGGHWRSTGWNIRVTAMETIPPQQSEWEEAPMHFAWGPELIGDTIAYAVANTVGNYGFGEVVDHMRVVGVGFEDGVELVSYDEFNTVEEAVTAYSQYEAAVQLPFGLPDGIYACELTADCRREVQPRPAATIAFRVVEGEVVPA
jgi:hypothetical protein